MSRDNRTVMNRQSRDSPSGQIEERFPHDFGIQPLQHQPGSTAKVIADGFMRFFKAFYQLHPIGVVAVNCTDESQFPFADQLFLFQLGDLISHRLNRGAF